MRQWNLQAATVEIGRYVEYKTIVVLKMMQYIMRLGTEDTDTVEVHRHLLRLE